MRIRLAPGTTLTNVEGKEVLFSVRTGDSYGLNETAARMVRLALEMSLDDAAAQLAAREYRPNALRKVSALVESVAGRAGTRGKERRNAR